MGVGKHRRRRKHRHRAESQIHGVTQCGATKISHNAPGRLLSRKFQKAKVKKTLSLPPDAFKMGDLTKAQKLGYISNGRGTLIIEAADGNADDHEQLTLEENAQNNSG